MPLIQHPLASVLCTALLGCVLAWATNAGCVAGGDEQGLKHATELQVVDGALASTPHRVKAGHYAESYVLDDQRGAFVAQPLWGNPSGSPVDVFGVTDAGFAIVDLNPPIVVDYSNLEPAPSRTATDTVTVKPVSRAYRCPAHAIAKLRLQPAAPVASHASHAIEYGGGYAVTVANGNLNFVNVHCVATEAGESAATTPLAGQTHVLLEDQFQFGWEIESDDYLAILPFYRTSEGQFAAVGDYEWLGMVADSRMRYALAAQLKRDLMAAPYPEKYTSWRRLGDTFESQRALLYTLAPELYVAANGQWETHNARPFISFQAAQQSLSSARQAGLKGTSHFHVSFPIAPVQQAAPIDSVSVPALYAQYFLLLNEYLLLRHLYEFPELALAKMRSGWLRPVLAREVAHLAQVLDDHQSGMREQYRIKRDNPDFQRFKAHYVGFRTPYSYGDDRFGLEIRSLSTRPTLQEALVQKITATLATPDRQFAAANGTRYTLAELLSASSDLLDENLCEREIADQRLCLLLETAAAHYTLDAEWQWQDMHLIWMIPLVHYETRLFLRHLSSEISARREAFKQNLTQTLTEFSQDPTPKTQEDYATLGFILSSQVVEWASHPQLMHHYTHLVH